MKSHSSPASQSQMEQQGIVVPGVHILIFLRYSPNTYHPKWRHICGTLPAACFSPRHTMLYTLAASIRPPAAGVLPSRQMADARLLELMSLISICLAFHAPEVFTTQCMTALLVSHFSAADTLVLRLDRGCKARRICGLRRLPMQELETGSDFSLLSISCKFNSFVCVSSSFFLFCRCQSHPLLVFYHYLQVASHCFSLFISLLCLFCSSHLFVFVTLFSIFIFTLQFPLSSSSLFTNIHHISSLARHFLLMLPFVSLFLLLRYSLFFRTSYSFLLSPLRSPTIFSTGIYLFFCSFLLIHVNRE